MILYIILYTYSTYIHICCQFHKNLWPYEPIARTLQGPWRSQCKESPWMLHLHGRYSRPPLLWGRTQTRADCGNHGAEIPSEGAKCFESFRHMPVGWSAVTMAVTWVWGSSVSYPSPPVIPRLGTKKARVTQDVSATFYFISGFFGSTWYIWASCMLISISMVHSFSLLCSISLCE